MEDLKRQLEQAVRDKLDLQRRLSQHSASTSMPAVFNPADLTRQLEQTNQQMVFKEQEVHICHWTCSGDGSSPSFAARPNLSSVRD